MSQPRVTVTLGRGGKRVQRNVTVPTEMYADRANGDRNRKRSIRDRLGGLSEQYSSLPQPTGAKRQRDIEGQWKHDLFFDELDDGPRGQSGRPGAQDLRSKLTRYVPRTSNNGKANVVDLRDKLSGISSQTPQPTPVQEAPKAQRRVASVVYNSSVVTHAVTSTPAPAPAASTRPTTVTLKKPSGVNAMTEEQTVRTLLHSLGLEKYVTAFQVEEIDMAALRYMSDNDLKELGIPMGPRKKILLAIRGKEQ